MMAVTKLQFSTACHTSEVFWKPLGTMFSCAVAKLIEFCNRLYINENGPPCRIKFINTENCSISAFITTPKKNIQNN
jgi:hypothetical protein